MLYDCSGNVFVLCLYNTSAINYFVIDDTLSKYIYIYRNYRVIKGESYENTKEFCNIF